MAITPPLSGVVPAGTSASPDALVLVLHGYGADAASMDRLVRQLAVALPRAMVVAIDGPEELSPNGGHRWFDVAGVTENGRGPRARAAVPAVERIAEQALAAIGLDHMALALVGFSQGATMALQYAVSAAAPPRAIVALAGRLAGDIDAAGPNRTTVMLAHGGADPVIAPEEMASAARRLRAAGFPVEAHLTAGLGHAIAPEQVEKAIAFLDDALPPSLAPPTRRP